MSDNQSLKMALEVSIPQEALEEVAKAIPAVDMTRTLISGVHGNEGLLQGLIAAIVRELAHPRSEHLARALRGALDATTNPRS